MGAHQEELLRVLRQSLQTGAAAPQPAGPRAAAHLLHGQGANQPRAPGESVQRYRREDFLVDGVAQPLVSCGAIRGFFGTYRCLSMFHMHPVTVEELTYACGEAAFQAQKSLDPEVRQRFAGLKTAREAQQLGQQIQLRPNWDEVHRFHAMYRVSLAKYQQDGASRRVLLSTDGLYLEESNWWGDDFWGRCSERGLNNLGHTLMCVRELMATCGPLTPQLW